MSYVTVIWAGRRRQRNSDPPREVPAEDCLTRLGLRQDHYSGERPPYIASSNVRLDDVRAPYGVAVHLRAEETPPGWKPGWYVIPSAALDTEAARAVLTGYAVTEMDSWMRPREDMGPARGRGR